MSAGWLRATLRALFRSESGELRADPPLQPPAGTTASGAAAVAVGGDAPQAQIGTHVHLYGADSGKVVEDLLGWRASGDSLPADLGDFEGRGREVERLMEILTKGGGKAAVTAIGGMGGLGKSALAVHVAHLLQKEAPDGRVFVDLGGTTGTPFAALGTQTRGAPLTPVEAMVKVVAALEPEKQVAKEEEAAARAYQAALDRKRVLLLLDNAENSAQVRPLLDWRAPTTMVVVTSRQTITAPGLEGIDLDVMEPDEARQLLRAVLGTRAASDNELDLFAERCGRLPLALRVAGTYLAQNPHVTIERYLRDLAEEKGRLGALGSEEDASLDVYAALGLSARRLAEEKPDLEARWRLLAVFPASFDAAAAAAIWEIEADAAATGLSDLRRRSMVLWDAADNRWRLHDLMRDVAQVPLEGLDQATLEARLEVARARHARHYCATLAAAGDLYLKGGEGALAGLALYGLEQRNIATGQGWCALKTKTDETAATLAAAFGKTLGAAHVLGIRLHPRERVDWLEAQRKACVRLGDRRGEIHALGNLGIAWRHLGEARRAIELYEQSLAVAHETGDRQGERNALGNLGNAFAELNDPRRAIEFYAQALKISGEIGDRRSEGSVLSNLGVAWKNLGEPRRAIEFFKQRLAIAREIGDRQGEGAALGNLALPGRSSASPGGRSDSTSSSSRSHMRSATGGARATVCTTLAVSIGSSASGRRRCEGCARRLEPSRPLGPST